MADIRPETPYPPSRQKAEENKQREVKQVGGGKLVQERKPGFFEKMLRVFFTGTLKEVTDSVMSDVVLPGLRDMFFDAVTGGASRAVYGDGSPTARTYSNRTGTRDYGRYSKSRTIGFQNDPPEETPTTKAKTVVNEVLFPTREKADNAKTEILGTLAEYGVITVHDLHRIAGIERTWAQDSLGWYRDTIPTDRDITITYTRDGWLLHLPRPVYVDI